VYLIFFQFFENCKFFSAVVGKGSRSTKTKINRKRGQNKTKLSQ